MLLLLCEPVELAHALAAMFGVIAAVGHGKAGERCTAQFQVNAPDGRREAGAALVNTICSRYGMSTDEIRDWTPPAEQQEVDGA
ncbi:MAG TPA: hypothetical protein VF788_19180 [Pseudonocardiaceae bacterium]